MGPDTGPLNDDDADPNLDESPTDVIDLPALVGGYWSAWHGLEPLPTRATVEEQLGPSIDEQPHGGVLGGSPTQFLRFRPEEAGPLAIVWYEGELAVAVQLEQVGQSPLDVPLGEPEASFESAFGDDWEQRIYGRRGLVVHVRSDATDLSDVALAFGLAPFHSDEFGDDPIRFEGGRRRRPSR